MGRTDRDRESLPTIAEVAQTSPPCAAAAGALAPAAVRFESRLKFEPFGARWDKRHLRMEEEGGEYEREQKCR